MPQPADLWEYRLQPEDDGKKFGDILKNRFHFSHRLLQHIKQGERAWANGRFTYLTARGKAGDLLSVQLFEREEATIAGEDLPLDILYEDDYILALNKPPGQVVHPTPRYPSGTVGNAVVGYWERRGESRLFRPIHRIDRNTSGLVVIAKNRFAHQQLARQLERRQIKKVYLGIVQGLVADDEGRIDAPIGLTPGSYVLRTIVPDGLPSLTCYKVLKRYPSPEQKASLAATLMEFTPVTGRTHQIRVHCQAFGHPLLGDDFYGGSQTLISRQALHSSSYTFKHPLSGEMLTLTAPLPEDMLKLISLYDNTTHM